MTFKLLGFHLTFNYRTGVAFDIEFTESRPIWVTGDNIIGVQAFAFIGIVMLIPFCMITYGKVYELGDF